MVGSVRERLSPIDVTRLSIDHILDVAVLVIEDMQRSLSAGDHQRYRRDVGRLVILTEALVNYPQAGHASRDGLMDVTARPAR